MLSWAYDLSSSATALHPVLCGARITTPEVQYHIASWTPTVFPL